MSTMSDLDLQLQEVSQAMSDQPEPIQIEYRLDCIIRDLDELCALALKGKVPAAAASQILVRAQLIAGFVEARNPPVLKVVRNNG